MITGASRQAAHYFIPSASQLKRMSIVGIEIPAKIGDFSVCVYPDELPSEIGDVTDTLISLSAPLSAWRHTAVRSFSLLMLKINN